MFALINVIVCNSQCSEKLFDEIVETLVFLASVLKKEIVCQPVFKQRHGNGVLSVEMLCKKKWGEGLFYALELGIEGTIVEMDFLDDRIAFDVVVICLKLKIEDFDVLLLKQCD